ncbi:hypothetical protein DSCW_08640 [Desulfosarcina widdelii]|uniref:Uncharacterized protein n=1 Tax=Desulfosarcina widdelii TaxID=947919 RepID=A0A5K7ZAF4_9BACT|nr:hypothetical protein DSCW_08640 [Desulfosarcina widdelii]
MNRICPHDDIHDRIRRTLGYVRDGNDDHHSVCMLCWMETAKSEKDLDRFHSPHGAVVCTF